MKRILLGLILVVSILLTSCNRNVRTFTGDYSYKLSGDIVFMDSEGIESHSIQTQRGQVNILNDKQGDKNDVVITVNQLNGTVYSFSATIKGDSIILKTHDCVMEFSDVSTISELTQVKKPYYVHISGRGILHDNMLILDEQWTGERTNDSSYTLHANKISVIAEQND